MRRLRLKEGVIITNAGNVVGFTELDIAEVLYRFYQHTRVNEKNFSHVIEVGGGIDDHKSDPPDSDRGSVKNDILKILAGVHEYPCYLNRIYDERLGGTERGVKFGDNPLLRTMPVVLNFQFVEDEGCDYYALDASEFCACYTPAGQDGSDWLMERVLNMTRLTRAERMTAPEVEASLGGGGGGGGGGGAGAAVPAAGSLASSVTIGKSQEAGEGGGGAAPITGSPGFGDFTLPRR